jgi:hypothetical protein
LKTWNIFTILAATAFMLFAQVPPEFTLSTYGPHTVFKGKSVLFGIEAKLSAGSDERAEVIVSGLPEWATVTFPNQEKYCCQTGVYRISEHNSVKVTTSADAPLGSYTIHVTYSSMSGVRRTASHILNVMEMPRPLQSPTSAAKSENVPLSAAKQWSTNMVTYGRKHCNPANLSLWEGSVWYYDGIRVYYQIADITGDPFWINCAHQVKELYATYVIENQGGIPAWRVFPHGLGMDFQRTKMIDSDRALSLMLSHSAYASTSADPVSRISFENSREVAYALDLLLVWEALGHARNPEFDAVVEAVFGHFDQWFISKNASYVQPFMVALSAEALISYYDMSHDPRVPAVMKLAADDIWTTHWDSKSKSFLYTEPTVRVVPAPDLNLLIAPLYGFVYQHTGDPIYRQRGDQIFASGVANAWLDGGKQFSQNYRWSNKYLQWRQLPSASPVGSSRR